MTTPVPGTILGVSLNMTDIAEIDKRVATTHRAVQLAEDALRVAASDNERKLAQHTLWARQVDRMRALRLQKVKAMIEVSVQSSMDSKIEKVLEANMKLRKRLRHICEDAVTRTPLRVPMHAVACATCQLELLQLEARLAKS